MGDWEGNGRDLLDRANRAWESGDRLNAERLYRQVIDEFPDRPEGYNKVGMVLAETGSLGDAEEYFLMALTKDRTFAPALTNIGNLYLERGQPEEAIKHYMLALQSDPDYPAAHRNLGVAYRRMGKYHSYVSHFKRSQRLDTRRARQEFLDRRARGAGQDAPRPQVPSWIWLGIAAVGVLLILTVFRR